jgi:hypothetical protein
MAGFIEMKDGRNIEFHIGQVPEYRVGGMIDEVVSVQLDGDELAHLSHSFNNIPFNVKVKVQVWRGDLAKFIIENW